MSDKEIEQQNMIEKQNINPTIDNLDEQLPLSKEVSAEKMGIAKKLILASLGVESNISLDAFDEQLEKATKTLPRYQEIENELKAGKMKSCPMSFLKH